MHPQFYEASFTLFLTTGLAAYTLRHGQPGYTRRLYVALLASILVWSGGVALSRVSGDARLAILGVKVSFLGIFALPPFWYALAEHLTRPNPMPLTRRKIALLSLPSLVAFTLMATNGAHHLYMRDPMAIAQKGPLDWAGPAFWPWAAWSYSLVLAGSTRYVRWSWRLVHGDARWRGALIGLASVMPLTGNVAHVAGLTAGDHDSTVFMLGGSVLMLFFADWRFRMLDTLPVARRDVIEQLRDGVVVTGVDAEILDVNPAAESMLGAKLRDLVGRSLVDVLTEQSPGRFDLDTEACSQLLDEMRTTASGFETLVAGHGGKHFEIRGGSVRDDLGTESGIYFVMRDVTSRQRYEDVRRESRRAHSIASLAAGITHEVNNPLSYVRANVGHVMEALARMPDAEPEDASKPHQTDELREALADALEGIDRIGDIVERVRGFTRTRGAERESIDVEMLVNEALRLVDQPSNEQIQVVAEIERGLPAVLGYRDGLLEAVVHLLENAERVLREMGGKIHMRASLREHMVRIEVEDNGPGVPDAMHDQIFEPFYTDDCDDAGSGLGLAISRKLVADLGGTLAYEAGARGGARFVIELPEARVASPPPA